MRHPRPLAVPALGAGASGFAGAPDRPFPSASPFAASRLPRASWRSLCLALSAFLSPGLAYAQTDPASAAAAQTLFDEGKKLLDEGQAVKACPKFAESQRLDPGGGTLMFLALCLEQEGKTASAYVAFNEALSIALRDRRADREKVAKEHLEAIAPRLRRLVVVVPSEVAAIPDLAVERDGAPVPKALWGTAVPVDPGAHAVTAKAPGRQAWTGTAEVRADGATETLTIGPLRELAPAAAPAPAPRSEPPSAVPAQPPPAASAPPAGRTQRILAIVAGSMGVGGVGVGSAFGLVSMAKHDEAAKRCSKGTCEDQAGLDANNAALSAGDASTVLFLAGGALAAGGVVLWVTAPKAEAPKIGVAVAPGWAGLGGGW